MEDTEKTYPYQLGLSVTMYGRSFPIWVYDKVPEGMRRVTSIRELRYGKLFLFRSVLSERVEYMTSVFRPAITRDIEIMIDRGWEVYIK